MTTAELTDEQREARRTQARDLIEARLTETWPAWRRPGRKPNLALAADIALDSLGDLAAEILVDGTMLRALTFRDGVATLELGEATEMVRIFAAGMRGVLDGHGASNYVEMEMTDGATGQGYTVTVQRRERPTPHQFRQQAEAKVAELEARLAELAAPARRILGTTEQADTVTAPAVDRRERYAAAIRDTDGWVLDDGQHMIDAVMAVADAEMAALRAEAEGLDEALRGAITVSEKENNRLRADRAAALNEAADYAQQVAKAMATADEDWASRAGWACASVTTGLRRLAAEAQQPTPAPAEETK